MLSAGTSDISVAREAFLTAQAMGNRVESIFDVGVAGIHRAGVAQDFAALYLDTPGGLVDVVNLNGDVAIAAASGNSVYGFVLRMVHGNIQKYYEAHPLKDERILKENYDDLCEIVRALEKKQATAVKSLVRGHVRRFNRYMSKVTMPPESSP